MNIEIKIIITEQDFKGKAKILSTEDYFIEGYHSYNIQIMDLKRSNSSDIYEFKLIAETEDEPARDE